MQKVTYSDISSRLLCGDIGVIPTDTVYGLVALAANQDAVAKLYKLKRRTNKPGTVIAASVDQLVTLGIPKKYLKPVLHYWPNPISVIVPAHGNLSYIHQGKHSLAVRIPDDEQLSMLLASTGPLLTSSANQPGQVPVTTIEKAYDCFGDDVDFYVDGGDCTATQASTIIQVIDDAVAVVREGSIHINESGEIIV